MREEKALKWIDGAVIVAAVATVPLVVIEARAVSSPREAPKETLRISDDVDR